MAIISNIQRCQLLQIISLHRIRTGSFLHLSLIEMLLLLLMILVHGLVLILENLDALLIIEYATSSHAVIPRFPSLHAHPIELIVQVLAPQSHQQVSHIVASCGTALLDQLWIEGAVASFLEYLNGLLLMQTGLSNVVQRAIDASLRLLLNLVSRIWEQLQLTIGEVICLTHRGGHVPVPLLRWILHIRREGLLVQL